MVNINPSRSDVWYVYTNEWGTMLLNKEQLVKSLLQLVQGDYDLLTDMITDYVDRLDDADLDGLETYVNNNINELM